MSASNLTTYGFEFSSEHGGESLGFSSQPCTRCHSPLSGERFEWTVLWHSPGLSKIEPQIMDPICISCMEEIEL